jgi:VWFA-related protein
MNVFSARSAVITLLLALASPLGHAQQATPQPTPQRAPGVLKEGVRAVLVDVVVRDRRGEPVRDLTEADFEILEDGVPQQVGSFTPVFPGAPAPARAAAGAGAAPPAPGGGGAPVASPPVVNTGDAVTALVFDRLSPDGRRSAVQAARSYLGSSEQAPHYFGIFGIDNALTPYVPFTRSAYALRQALERVGSGASASFNHPEQQQQRANADQQAALAGANAAAAQAAGGPGAAAAIGGAPGDAMLAQMSSQMIKDFDQMERDQQGYGTTNGLFAVISALGKLPGRKSLVLFSEGLSIPPAVQRLFLGVIDAANRANVSIYAMDAAGLRALSEQAKIRDRVNQAAGFGGGILGGGGSGGEPLTKALEQNEDVLRQDPHHGLGTLAQSTGGLFFDSTNNLRQGFERIESDLRNYYLVGYTPANTTYDGRFRTIDVRVKRPGVTVAARRGYFAVADPGGMPMAAWEAPALAAIAQTPVPNAFPVRAAALLFPEPGRPGLVPVVVDFKTAPLTFQPSGDGKTYSSDFAVLVRFLDQQNQVTRKVSQHYEVNGPLESIDGAKRGEVIFYREPELPAGLYTMETVVLDTPSGKSSVRFSTIEVPSPAAGALRVSSLVLVKRGEKVPDKDRRADNPLLVNDVVIFPNLGEPVSKAAKEAGFFFAVYPAPNGPAPESTLELLENGKLAARLPLPAPRAESSGRMPFLGRLPITQLPAGTYELRAVVTQGDSRIIRSTMLRIAE